MPTAPRFVGLGAALGLAVGLLLGVVLTQPGHAAASNPSMAPTAAPSGAAVGLPAPLPPVTTGGSNGTTVVSSGAAIAYPYVAGSPGIAPDHTILVTGVGQADMSTDGGNRAAAQKAALSAALADAKAQAEAIAAATGLSIGGVLSVSASVSPVYGVVPMAGSVSGGAPGQPVPPTVPEPAYPQTLNVSVTVAYRVS